MKKLHKINAQFTENNNIFLKQSSNHVNNNFVNEQIYIVYDKFENRNEAETAIKLAAGRIFKIMSRPFEEGDVEIYEKCKDLIMEAQEYLN